MSVAWGQIAATAVLAAAATRVVGRSLNRAQAQACRVQAAAMQLRAWYLVNRSRFIVDPPGFEEVDGLLAQIGKQPLRRLVVVWYSLRTRRGEWIDDNFGLDPTEHADQTMRALAGWHLAESVLEPVLCRLVGGRRWPIPPWTRWRIRRLWTMAGKPLAEEIPYSRLMAELVRQLFGTESEGQ